MVAIEVKSKTRKGVPTENALTRVLESRYFHRDDWKTIAYGASAGFNSSLKELEKIEDVIREDIRNSERIIAESESALDELAALRQKYERAALLWDDAIDNERSNTDES